MQGQNHWSQLKLLNESAGIWSVLILCVKPIFYQWCDLYLWQVPLLILLGLSISLWYDGWRFPYISYETWQIPIQRYYIVDNLIIYLCTGCLKNSQNVQITLCIFQKGSFARTSEYVSAYNAVSLMLCLLVLFKVLLLLLMIELC